MGTYSLMTQTDHRQLQHIKPSHLHRLSLHKPAFWVSAILLSSLCLIVPWSGIPRVWCNLPSGKSYHSGSNSKFLSLWSCLPHPSWISSFPFPIVTSLKAGKGLTKILLKLFLHVCLNLKNWSSSRQHSTVPYYSQQKPYVQLTYDIIASCSILYNQKLWGEYLNSENHKNLNVMVISTFNTQDHFYFLWFISIHEMVFCEQCCICSLDESHLTTKPIFPVSSIYGFTYTGLLALQQCPQLSSQIIPT